MISLCPKDALPRDEDVFLLHLGAFYDVTKGTGTWLITPARCSFHTALFFASYHKTLLLGGSNWIVFSLIVDCKHMTNKYVFYWVLLFFCFFVGGMNHHPLELLSWGLFFFFLKQTVQSLNINRRLCLSSAFWASAPPLFWTRPPPPSNLCTQPPEKQKQSIKRKKLGASVIVQRGLDGVKTRSL